MLSISRVKIKIQEPTQVSALQFGSRWLKANECMWYLSPFKKLCNHHFEYNIFGHMAISLADNTSRATTKMIVVNNIVLKFFHSDYI